MSEKVLIVDDTPANLIALGAVLKPLGVEVVEARSGEEAIAKVKEHDFAVVLLDVQMPEMDGFEVAKRLRETSNGEELPIIFLTAIHRDEGYVRKGYVVGAADYITKPFDVDVLRARVRAFVDLFRQRDRIRIEQLSKALDSERAARRLAEIASTAKDELLATVSHELRTPLNSILGWSVMARGMTDNPRLIEALATIERNARAQMRVVDDLLDMGSIQSGKLRLVIVEVSVEQAIRAAALSVQPAAAAKGVELAVEVTPGIDTIAADADRLQQMVWNLLTNAIKFTDKGDHVRLSAARQGDAVTIEVRDDGPGIAPDVLPHVFEAFKQADQSATRRHGGLGLGLTIVKKLAQAHGGDVVAQSDGLGKGSTFRIELPVRLQNYQTATGSLNDRLRT